MDRPLKNLEKYLAYKAKNFTAIMIYIQALYYSVLGKLETDKQKML